MNLDPQAECVADRKTGAEERLKSSDSARLWSRVFFVMGVVPWAIFAWAWMGGPGGPRLGIEWLIAMVGGAMLAALAVLIRLVADVVELLQAKVDPTEWPPPERSTFAAIVDFLQAKPVTAKNDEKNSQGM